GRLGVVGGLDPDGLKTGQKVAVHVEGRFHLAKAASVVLLAGQEVYWVPASNAASFYAPGRIYAGVCLADAAAADATVLVDLIATKRYAIDSRQGQWTTTAVNNTGAVVLPGGTIQLAIDNGNEAGKVVILSDATIDVDDKPILEVRFAIFDASDNTVDVNIGLASGDHATDFESITAFVSLQVDGGSLNLNVHSDDNVTDQAPVDSTLDYVDDTYHHGLFDLRDKTAIKIYVDGVPVAPATGAIALAAYTSTLRAAVHAEKTTGTATADVRVEFLRAWAQRA
ncbi:MAG: capsid cement protein, partial [Planctomycetia bacterium]